MALSESVVCLEVGSECQDFLTKRNDLFELLRLVIANHHIHLAGVLELNALFIQDSFFQLLYCLLISIDGFLEVLFFETFIPFVFQLVSFVKILVLAVINFWLLLGILLRHLSVTRNKLRRHFLLSFKNPGNEILSLDFIEGSLLRKALAGLVNWEVVNQLVRVQKYFRPDC